jgi:hypothetical protein
MFRPVVNKPEPPTESLRRFFPKSDSPASRKAAGTSFVPQYVDLPRPPHRVGLRNLRWGAATLVLAFVLVSIAIALAGSLRASVPLLTAFATFTLLWIAARLRLFHQRHGIFLALGLVATLGALVPLLEQGLRAAHARFRPIVAQALSPTTSAAETPRHDETPLLTRELGIPRTDPDTTSSIRVLKDSRVLVGGKPYLIKAGEVFPFDSTREDEVVFQAKDLRLSLPLDAVEVLPASGTPHVAAAGGTESVPASSPAPATASTVVTSRKAQREAVRRYPALGVKDSPENKLFVETYRDLKANKSELLDDPEWPLVVADLLAKREGWERKEP